MAAVTPTSGMVNGIDMVGIGSRNEMDQDISGNLFDYWPILEHIEDASLPKSNSSNGEFLDFLPMEDANPGTTPWPGRTPEWENTCQTLHCSLEDQPMTFPDCHGNRASSFTVGEGVPALGYPTHFPEPTLPPGKEIIMSKRNSAFPADSAERLHRKQPRRRKHQLRNASKFSLSAVSLLQTWLDTHQDDPFPSQGVKADLAKASKLTEKQVATWFINARKRQMNPLQAWLASCSEDEIVSEKDIIRASELQHVLKEPILDVTPPEIWEEFNAPKSLLGDNPIAFSPGYVNCELPSCNAKYTAVNAFEAHALQHTENQRFRCNCESIFSTFNDWREHARKWHHYDLNLKVIALPVTQPTRNSYDESSWPRSCGSSISGDSSTSAFSQCSDAVLSGPPRRGRKKNLGRFKNHSSKPTSSSKLSSEYARKAMSRTALRISHTPEDMALGLAREVPWQIHSKPLFPQATECSEEELGIEEGTAVEYPCTFCHKKFTRRAWKRHEETSHLPRVKWTCMARGFRLYRLGTIDPPIPEHYACCFCYAPNPTDSHAESCHRIAECLARPEEERTFFRRDHLAQHLKNYHGVALLDQSTALEWKSPTSVTPQEWPCGFCGDILPDWDVRASHILDHFRQGLKMESWNSNRH
ncbi:hypothetical protein K432DRAFT_424471 [Lepidopterella palustris CBS 459.81]|uniref:Homeobox domain-containing protein n=1 Tax=Lepidopterella palustris CBS 459.81 TaxID=1314670 RepID=A0A8E2JH06_9PEZI|nr:hypothetical protein K432DRAFT_424471 [Lepidopterella palustris CBS 459.81]